MFQLSFRLLLLAAIATSLSRIDADEPTKRRDAAADRTGHAETKLNRIAVPKLVRLPEMVHVNVTFAVSDTQTGQKKIVDELKMATLADTEATLEFGQQMPIPSGGSQARSGTARVIQYQTHTVGTIVKVTPTITAQGIRLKLMAEKSWIDFAGERTDDTTMLPPSIYNASTQTTLALSRGESYTIQALVSGGTKSGRVMLITVSASSASEVKERTANKTVRHPRPAPREAEATPPGRDVSRPDSRSRSTANSGEAPEAAGDDPATNIAKRLFQNTDANSDGKLDLDEAEKLPKPLRSGVTSAGQTIEEFSKRFTQFLDERKLKTIKEL